MVDSVGIPHDKGHFCEKATFYAINCSSSPLTWFICQ